MTRAFRLRLSALGLAVVCGWSAALAAEPVRLITPEEARLPPGDPVPGEERAVTRGPGIDAVAPSPVGVSGPFRLAVKFKPRNTVAIDPDSVRVTYRRQPEVDLTARLKPFVTPTGIEAPAVVVPPGRHVLVIEALDLQGRMGRSLMTLTVTEPK
ncbi:hypothetical protein [uncultured Alsobacter sp.]|uniref:hypothetical protein n=1 Tax=uncultured Alsobacter sp. TaxID=1748258 RepID=UPI0025F5C10F|nr:hypothetical protein [uncultured Alsobacter sp.]